MNPSQAMLFLSDLNKAGWAIAIGPVYVAATHNNWGCAIGRGEDLAERLDNLRETLRKRDLCE